MSWWEYIYMAGFFKVILIFVYIILIYRIKKWNM